MFLFQTKRDDVSANSTHPRPGQHRVYLSTTAVIALTLAIGVGALSSAQPAMAQASGGAGGGSSGAGAGGSGALTGSGGSGGGSNAATPGASSQTGNGAAGTNSSGGGGGGGAGQIFGAGGAGGGGATGGASAGAAGGSVSGDFGGGGGAGGQHGFVGAALPVATTSGGNGGGGGAAQGGTLGDGGGGGAGGFGAVVTGAITGPTTLGGAITGGAGGQGGASMQTGGTGSGGGGGGGGLGLLFQSTSNAMTINQAVTGGAGGVGGSTTTWIGDGGGGGGGGAGIVFSGAATDMVINANVTGGAGGGGGSASPGAGTGSGGIGGGGGAGLTFLSGGSVTVNGTVRGGNGGTGGNNVAGAPTTNGAGGVGVTGANLTVINAGTIAGGSGADAVYFTGGTNTFELRGGATTTGNVVASGGGTNDTFRLGGATSGTFNLATIAAAGLYRGFDIFEKSGTSVWTTTGATGATMAWRVNDGTLNLDASTQTASSLVMAGGTLQGGTLRATEFDVRAGNIATVLADNGAAAYLVKSTAGTAVLSGNNTYTGTTTVNAGSLIVTGAITSAVTVNSGATLGGGGAVGTTRINSATLAPGSATGTMTVNGDLVFDMATRYVTASNYMVEVSPTSASRVNVTGVANLGGAIVNANFAAGSYVEKKYTIVTAGTRIVDTFGSQVNTNLPTNFTTALSYDAHNAYLNLTLQFVPNTPLPIFPAFNINQSYVSQALIDFFNRTGRIQLVFAALDAAGLTQVSGETAPGAQNPGITAAGLFLSLISDPTSAGRDIAPTTGMGYADEALAYAGKRAPTDAFAAMLRKAPPMAQPFQARWNMWVSGFGGSQITDGNALVGSNKSSSSIYGAAVGADYWFSPFTVAGFSMAGGGTNFSVDGGGTGRSDLFQAGGFVRHTVGSIYVTASAAYGWQDITTDRFVTVAGIDHLRANFNANTYSGRVEVGNRFVMPWIGGIGLTPYAAFQVTAFDLPSYAETAVSGANTFALSYAGKTAVAPRSELGLRSDKSFAVNDAILTLRGRAAWAHDMNRDRSASATFQSLPGASFVVNGASLAKHTALTSASAELKWMNGWSVAGTFEGEFSDVTRSYAGKGVARYAW